MIDEAILWTMVTLLLVVDAIVSVYESWRDP